MAKKRAFDKTLFTTLVALVALGLVMVYSVGGPRARGEVSEMLFTRQAIAAALGFVALAVAMHVPYRTLRNPLVVYGMLLAGLALLVAVLFQPSVNSARRWILFGPLSLQASEIAKLALIPFIAYQIDRKQGDVNRIELLAPVLFVVGLTATLVLVEPDQGTSVLLVGLAFVMLFLAGLKLRWVATAGLVLVPAAAFLALSASYRRARLLSFLDPEADPLGNGYQALQSLIAIGSGGLFGRGPGQSLQKLYYLPQSESDFVFSILAEELGLLGGLLVLAGFTLLLWRGVRAGLNAPDLFGRYLALGITTVLTVQALLNVGVATALLPTTGVPLPFISYGGSSLLVAMTMGGILLNISEHG
jgi:cell division protein FtsW